MADTKINRRQLLKHGAAAVAGSALVAGAPYVAAAPKSGRTFRWKMVTTWPAKFPVMGEGAELLANWIEEMSAGRLKIKVYGAGERVPALGTFDSVSVGTAQMGHGAAYYWAGKVKAAQFFAAVPFGMNAQQMNAWIYSGGGLELWEQIYDRFNLIPMPAGNTGVQMGGWFNKEIKSIADIKGLKMRIPGLGGKVISKAGGSAVLSAGGEIYTNLERGVIDATEWVGPYHDFLMGFHKIAKYYYYPGWHEPGTVLELIINKKAFNGLPPDLQQIVRSAAARSNLWMLSEFESKNNDYLKKLVTEHNVQLRRFPDDVLKAFKKFSGEVIDEITAKDPASAKVYKSFKDFSTKVQSWAEVSEKSFHAIIGGQK